MANNIENLKPRKNLTSEEAKEMGRRGGIASGESRRARKTLKQDLKLILDLKDKEGNTFQENMTKALIKQALKGNVRAYEVARDTIGEEQEQIDNFKISLPASWLAKSFSDINRDIDGRKHLEYWFLGGRGSTKSTYWGDKVIELLNNNPKMNALIIRKVSNTLKDSVFANLKKAISKWEKQEPRFKGQWKATKNPLEINNLVTGQKIFFRGADDPDKIKSVTSEEEEFYIGITVYEEFDQMNGMAEIRKINQSVIRGGQDFVQIYACNTPKSLMHFVNKEVKIPKENRIVHFSDYRDVPVEWLGQPFIDEAEYLKEINPTAYEHEYLGKAVGVGGVVFENVEVREISDSEIEQFDYIYNGIDWGYYPDAFQYGKMYYNSSKRELYIYYEFRALKKGNTDLHEMLIEEGIDITEYVTADSAEPKSIGDFKKWGWNIRGANKASVNGKGYIVSKMKWLQSLNKIIIDPSRCPETTKEFLEYEYLKDKEGNDISAFPDKNNHGIDMVTYAMEPVWRKSGE